MNAETAFACRYRKPQFSVTLLMDHERTDWTQVFNAAFRHLGLKPDPAVDRRGYEVLAARRAA